MRNYFILICSLILFVTGILVPSQWLAMHSGEHGDLFIPVSSGSEDPFAIKLALASYMVSFIYSGLFVYLKKEARSVLGVYWANCIFYLFCMYLVSLDSSIIQAAKFGNLVPVSLSLLWLVTFVIVIGVSCKKVARKGNASDAY